MTYFHFKWSRHYSHEQQTETQTPFICKINSFSFHINAKNDPMPYVPSAMILRQQSYTISRSLTCLPIFPCLMVLLGKCSFIHFDNATFYRFGISFAQLLHAKLQQPVSACVGKKRTHPTVSLKEQELKTTLPMVSNKRGFCLLLVSSLKKASIPPHFISLEPGWMPQYSGQHNGTT